MIHSATRQRGPVVADSDVPPPAASYVNSRRGLNPPQQLPPQYRNTGMKVPPFPLPLIHQWNRTTSIFFWVGVAILATIIIAPIILLEGMASSTAGGAHPVSLHALLEASHKLRNNQKVPATTVGGESIPQTTNKKTDLSASANVLSTEAAKVENVPSVPPKRGHIECDVNVDDLVYWNDPQSSFDQHFLSPFLPHDKEERFLTFEPDSGGGWNTIRMSLENLIVFAAVTGRTLVVPPMAPMNLLAGRGGGSGGGGGGAAGPEETSQSLGNFFPLTHPALQKHVKIITMKEFLQTQGPKYLSASLSEIEIERELLPLADACVFQSGSDHDCDKLNIHLRKHGHQPVVESDSHCFLFDETYYTRANTKGLSYDGERIRQFCGNRTTVAYAATFTKYPWIHWQASDSSYRLGNHFYTFFHFTNETIGNHYKRLVRDFMHYTDDIFCTAGKIVHALQKSDPKVTGGGSYSSLHIRRGEFPYKEVFLTAEEWVKNTRPIFRSGEVLYIATDERNKTFFQPFIKQGYQLRFLDDYMQQFGISKLDPAFYGIIDSIVASHGRTFVGTFYSTFSGYIHRMRGYLGYNMKDSWYGGSSSSQQTAMHSYEYPHFPWSVREWPLGWEGIDEKEASSGSSNSSPKSVQADVVDLSDGTKGSLVKPVAKAITTAATAIKRTKPNITFSDISTLLPDADLVRNLPLARGVAGRPMTQTPALVGAKRGHIECDINVDSLAYWNDPQGDRDVNFKSPYAVEGGPKYISFAPDSGGWNNIRMSMEIIFVIAAATGRTLVLPPKEPLYLLTRDKKNKYRGFGDFFPLHAAEFQRRVPTISTEEFVKREGGKNGRLPIPEANRTRVLKSVQHCENRAKSEDSCMSIREYLESVGYVPQLQCGRDCVVFDEEVVRGEAPTGNHRESVTKFCGKRNATYWTSKMQEPILIHFKADVHETRLLAHFYGFVHFTNPVVDHYLKRFVRDFLHYNNVVYCAAGKIVKALQIEAESRGFKRDANGNGGYSSMHIRRGDFQFKLVKLSAEEWYNNTKELWQPKELIYIATDERNKTFFEPIAEHHELRYLDDYWQLANLSQLDPNYMGMIDTIVSSRGRVFAGTWFSTFSGYINRMRGYHGISMNHSWYSWLERKTAVHKWDDSDGTKYAFEWPSGWMGIDADTWPTRDVF